MRWTDIDANSHVNNAIYLRYFEEARVDLLGRARDFVADGDIDLMVVAAAQINYRRQLLYRPEPVRIDVWIGRLGRASYTIEHEIYDETPQGRVVYADGSVTMAGLDRATGSAKRISDGMREYLTKYLAS